jgi:hypothetical protein
MITHSPEDCPNPWKSWPAPCREIRSDVLKVCVEAFENLWRAADVGGQCFKDAKQRMDDVLASNHIDAHDFAAAVSAMMEPDHA